MSVSPSFAQHTRKPLHMLKIPCPHFDQRRPNALWHGNTQITYNSSRMIRIMTGYSRWRKKSHVRMNWQKKVYCSPCSNGCKKTCSLTCWKEELLSHFLPCYSSFFVFSSDILLGKKPSDAVTYFLARHHGSMVNTHILHVDSIQNRDFWKQTVLTKKDSPAKNLHIWFVSP